LITDAQDSEGFQLTVSDADAPNAARYEDFIFDGDESWTARQSGLAGRYEATFPASSFRGRATNEYSGDRATPTRILSSGVWQPETALDAGILLLHELEEVRKTPATAAPTGNLPDHARLVEIFFRDRRGLQVFGSRSVTAAIPSSGTATFVGEVYGNFFLAQDRLERFLGDAVITVDFARQTVTGVINASQYLGSGQATPAIRVEFAADISAGGFTARTLTVTGQQVFLGGTLKGAFYGPAADELGLAFSASGAGGNIIGALVAGKE
jgi:hypothetical protein